MENHRIGMLAATVALTTIGVIVPVLGVSCQGERAYTWREYSVR